MTLSCVFEAAPEVLFLLITKEREKQFIFFDYYKSEID